MKLVYAVVGLMAALALYGLLISRPATAVDRVFTIVHHSKVYDVVTHVGRKCVVAEVDRAGVALWCEP